MFNYAPHTGMVQASVWEIRGQRVYSAAAPESHHRLHTLVFLSTGFICHRRVLFEFCWLIWLMQLSEIRHGQDEST